MALLSELGEDQLMPTGYTFAKTKRVWFSISVENKLRLKQYCRLAGVNKPDLVREAILHKLKGQRVNKRFRF